MPLGSHARRAGLGALAAVVVVALAGCTGGSGDDTADSADSADSAGSTTTTAADNGAGLSATVVQQRLDVGTTTIGLEVTTDDQTTVHVSGVKMLTDAFAGKPVEPKDTDFAPGQTVDLTVNYGRPVCDPGITPDDAQVQVDYTAAGDDTEQSQTLPVARLGLVLLRHLHETGCAEQRLDEAASLTYADDFHREVVDGTLSLVGHMVLQRPDDGGSGEPVVLDSVLGSVLFEFVKMTEHGPVGSLPRGEDRAEIPVLIRGNDRCSAHERSAAQQVFVFTTDVRVGDGEQHREIIEPPRKLQVQSLALLDDVC
jgi:hypothetical protein